MSRTTIHLACALLWLCGFALAAGALAHFSAHDLERLRFYSQVSSIVWVLGFASIFYSWARQDAPAHGKSVGSAAIFAALWPFLIFFAHIAYLLFTRGIRMGTLATLKFVCFLLAAAVGWLLFGRVLGSAL